MRLFSLNKQCFIGILFGVVFFYLTTIFVGISGPPIISSTTFNASRILLNDASLPVGPYMLNTPTLSAFNQQLWISMQLNLDNQSYESFHQTVNISINVFTVNEDASSMSGLKYFTRTRNYMCNGELLCDTIAIMHFGYLPYSKMQIEISFDGIEMPPTGVPDIIFDVKTFNLEFTTYEIWFRFSLLILTFLVTSLFAHSLRKTRLHDWTIEQKWTCILLCLLLFYNDPIFPIKFIVTSWIPALVDSIVQVTFLSALLLFWLCVHHSLLCSDRPFLAFYVPKFIICGALWIISVLIYCWQQYHEIADPTYQYKTDMANYLILKIFFGFFIGLYLLYLGYLLVQGCIELHNKPYMYLRLKFISAFTACISIISLLVVAVRYRTEIFDDNFIAPTSTNDGNSLEYVALYGLINGYIYTLAFVYSSSNQQSSESILFHDGRFANMRNAWNNGEEMCNSTSSVVQQTDATFRLLS